MPGQRWAQHVLARASSLYGRVAGQFNSFAALDLSFQVAKQDRLAILLRQTLHFFAQLPCDRGFPGSSEAGSGSCPHRTVHESSDGASSQGHERGDTVGDAKEPAGQERSATDGTSLPCQHQERRLEGVGRVIRAIQHAPAHGVYQWPVPMEDGLERCLSRWAHETLQQRRLDAPDPLPIARIGQWNEPCPAVIVTPCQRRPPRVLSPEYCIGWAGAENNFRAPNKNISSSPAPPPAPRNGSSTVTTPTV